ncbi:hypothetical protein ACWEQL_20265 [Kitasatospora sp. NPDC004240]
MGTNSKSSHASYAIAPSDVAVLQEHAELAAPAASEPLAGPQLSDEAVEAKAQLMAAMENLETLAAGGDYPLGGEDPLPDDPVERYELFAQQIQDAREAIEKLKEQGLSGDEIKAQLDELRAQSLAYLTQLEPEELQQIAAAKGFEHPTLVGLSGKAQHPLVHWLDPYYGDGIASKNKIQAAALKRYEQLLAGESIGGMTLADLHQMEGTPVPSSAPDGMWAATPEQVDAAEKAWSAASQAAADAKGVLSSEQLKNLLDFEKHLLTAHNPDMPGLEKLQNGVKVWTGDPLAIAKINSGTVIPLVKDSLAAGEMTLTEAQHLKPLELVALMRAGTSEIEKEHLKALAQARKDQLVALDNAHWVHKEGKPDIHSELSLPDLAGGPEAAAKVAEWAKTTGELHSLQQQAQGWIHETLQSSDISMGNPGLLTSHQVDPKALTTEFNTWAKQQKLADLRGVAEQLGMPNADKATRANLQSYIAASFNPALDAQAIVSKVDAAAEKKAAAQTAPTAVGGSGLASPAAVQALASTLPGAAAPSTGTGLTAEAKVAAAIQMGASPEQAQKLVQAAPAAKPVPKAPAKPAIPGSFNAKVQALVASLQQAKATAQDVPARIDPAVVGSWSFGPGQAAHLGGTYPKTVHSAPDGSTWLFKTDHNGGSAIAHAEAAASDVLARGGLPAVPVYVKNIEGKAGTIQPMLKGATQFSAAPKSWSQADVDAIVRSHVGSWLIGDHDGHQGNVLRTASGGFLPIDRGQAFKHYGQDKLSVGYAPSGGGSFDPLHQKLYQASLAGGLADGVKINPAVVHPIIKNFEAIPDSQWRAMLHSTAHEGAKAGVHWVSAMRKAAAKKHGIAASQVTQSQIADAFLDHAVERKQRLREDFSAFLVKELKMPSAASLKHGAN